MYILNGWTADSFSEAGRVGRCEHSMQRVNKCMAYIHTNTHTHTHTSTHTLTCAIKNERTKERQKEECERDRERERVCVSAIRTCVMWL